MKKMTAGILILLLGTSGFSSAAADSGSSLKPLYHWNFDRAVKVRGKQKAPGLGVKKLGMGVANWSKNEGIGGSGALVSGEGPRSAAYNFPRLNHARTTIELSFKPTAAVTKLCFLFSYGENSYKRANFGIYLDGKGHVGARFLNVTYEGKKRKILKDQRLLSREHVFEVGKWYSFRVTMERRGFMKIYLNGRLENMVGGSVGLGDFKTTIPRDYPGVHIGSQVNNGTNRRPFTGLIDNVRIWNAVLAAAESATPASGASDEAVIVSKRVPAPPVIDGRLDDACWKAANKTRPFKVLGKMSSTVTGLWLGGEEKFVRTAATAQVCHDHKKLYVAFRAGAPDDVPAKATITQHDGRVWTEDCVELFIDPMRRMGYHQLLVNAIGTLADLRSLPGGAGDMKWESKAQVKVRRDGPGYIVEMAIPFASLGDDPHTAGTAWGINFTREGASGGGLSTWAPVGRTFATPERFGILIFEGLKAHHRKELARLEKELAGLSTDKTPRLAASASRMIASLGKRIKREGDRASAYSRLRNAAEEISATLRQIALKGRTSLLWRKDIWGPIAPDEKLGLNTKPLTSLDVFAGQNTRAATGFLLSNLSAKPLMGRFALVALRGGESPPKGANVLERGRVTFSRGVYIELSNGVMTPDALVKLLPQNLVEVPPRTTVLVWVELDTKGLAPGKYVRGIRFAPSYSGFESTAFDINLEVAPIDLAAPRVKQWAYLADVNASRHPNIAKDLVEHGVTGVYFLPGRNRGYPKLDKEGNIVSVDFSALDSMIDNFLAAGVAKDRLHVIINLAFNYPRYRNLCYEHYREQLEYGTDAWKKGFANALKAFRDHLFERGLTYEQIVFYVIDEPHGDPADPKSTAHIAIGAARYVKEVDPKFRTMCNPHSKKKSYKYLDDYIAVYDVLEPYRPHLASCPAALKKYQKSGREIWTYHILQKANSPTIYRNMAWQSARDGFTGVCPFWCYEGHAGDPFYSHDHHPKNPKRITDYGVVYAEYVRKRLTGEPGIPTRRWEAAYQGNQDYRAIVICRGLIAKLKAAGKAKDAAEYQSLLDKTIKKTVNKSAAAMDVAREKLVRAAVQMQNILGK